MKKFYILLFLALTCLPLSSFSQAPDWLWARTSQAQGNDVGKSVSIDASGNSYFFGEFRSISFRFGPTTLSNTNLAGTTYDLFLAKLDFAGAPVYLKQIGASGEEYAGGVCSDASGNSYVTGGFRSSSITIGTTTLTNQGSDDIFIAKYDASGNVLWAKGIGGSASDAGNGIAVDASGNVYVAGGFASSSITFGSTTLTSNGSGDIFIVKYDATGNVIWARNAGGTGADYCGGVRIDANGKSYITGYFQSSSIIFGTTTLINNGFYDFFLFNYDASGNPVWAKSTGGANIEEGSGVCIDAFGNSVTIGYFNSPSITFGSTTLISNGSGDIFIVKYNAAGNIVWAKSFGGTADEIGNSISADANGNTYITGSFRSPTVSFGTYTLTNVGQEDIFVAKLDTSGNVVWANSVGNTSSQGGYSICADGSGNSFIAGYYYGSSITFGTYTLNNMMAAGTTSEAFVAKQNIGFPGIPGTPVGPNSLCLNPPNSNYTTSGASGSDSYIWSINPAGAGTISGTGLTGTVNWNDTYVGTAQITVKGHNILGDGQPSLPCVVTISPLTIAGFVTGGSTICLGNSTGTLTLSGNTGTVNKWQKRLNSGSWIDIANTLTTYNEIPSTVGTWEYRAEVQSGACTASFSSSTNVIVVQPLAGSVSGGSTICFGNSTGTLTLSGHIGTISKWQKRLNAGTWIDIANTSSTYSEVPSSVGTWEYRAEVQNGGCSAFSTAATVIVEQTVAGSVSGGGTICLGNSTGTLTLSGHNGSINKWQKRLNVGSWIDISNTSNTYSEIPSSFGTWEYRAEVQIGSCSALFSTATTVVVNSVPPTPTITQNILVLSSNSPIGNQWYLNSSIIPGATNQSYTVTQNGDYFDIVTYNGCSSDTSNVITVIDVGIEFIENNKTFKVFPNPVTNELIIEIKGSKEETSFEILNSIGQVVFKGKVLDKLVVNTNEFSSGVYIIKFENGKIFEFRKIMKE